MPRTTCKLVAYYRVSTDKQGKSGLGIEAQTALIASYAVQNSCQVLASYTEVESGKRNDRPELAKAIAHARKLKATLVIATLSRLGRRVSFISSLMESGVPFIAADSPNDDRFTLHIKAAVAEEEAAKISQRTKAALAALKARGVQLGKPENMTQAAQVKGAKATRDQAIRDYATIVPMLRELREQGLSLRDIAKRLNDQGIMTRTGSSWSAMQVARILDRG